MCIFHKFTDHQETLEQILTSSCHSDISWAKILKLLNALTEIFEGEVQVKGNRICIGIRYSQERRVAIFYGWNCEDYVSSPTLSYIRDFLATLEIQLDK